MVTPIQQDLTYRLQYLTGLIATETIKLQSKLRLGEECVCEWEALEVSVMIYDVLRDFDFDADYNCISQLQVDKMFDYISNKYKFFFPPYQSNYTDNSNVSYDNWRITEDNKARNTEAGETRITEEN